MSSHKLEVFTDYVCPWCYLGDLRVKKLTNIFDIDIEIIHFPLHPDTPKEGKSLLDLFGTNQEDIDKKNQNMKNLMSNENLPYSNRTHTFNSRLAQEIGSWAQSLDNKTTIHDNFFEAYFVKGLNIGFESVILEIVTKSGLNKNEANDVMKNRTFKSSVDKDWQKSRIYGVTGVPTYIYNNHRVVGAQPIEKLIEFLNHFGVPKL